MLLFKKAGAVVIHATEESTLATSVKASNSQVSLETDFYVKIYLWREDNRWGQVTSSFSCGKGVGHVAMGIGKKGHFYSDDAYVSLWPAFGAGWSQKSGKIIPQKAVLQTHAEDVNAMSWDKKFADFQQIILISERDYVILKKSANDINVDVQNESLQYCAINTNFVFYGQSNIKAYNCMGLVLKLLKDIDISLNPTAVRFPSSFEKELKATFPTQMQNLNAIQECFEEDSSSDNLNNHQPL